MDSVAIIEELADDTLNHSTNVWGSFFFHYDEEEDSHRNDKKELAEKKKENARDTWWHAHIRAHANFVAPYVFWFNDFELHDTLVASHKYGGSN